jgi:hypothetical protein
VKQQVDHARIVSHRFAVFDNFPCAMGDRPDKFKFPGDDYLSEVTFANKVWYDVDIFALNHSQDFPKAWFLFPKAAIDFGEEPAANDLIRMLEGGRTRIGIQGGAMTHQNEGTLSFVRHGSKLDGSPEFLKWNSRSALPTRSHPVFLQNRVNFSVVSGKTL